MTRPKMLDYDHTEMAAVRETAFGRDLVEFLEWHVNASCAEVDAFTRQGRTHDAVVASGRTSAYRDLLLDLRKLPPQQAIGAADDDRDVDPAMPARARRK